MRKQGGIWQGVVISACALGLALILARCEETPTAPVIGPPPLATQPGPSRDSGMPATPIKLEKPRMLGPVVPAIVVLPADFREPTVRVRLTAESDRAPAVNAKLYRGKVQSIQLADGKYVAINYLPLDTYLVGVLAKEMYTSWSPTAYRAQAVAARTYALFQILTSSKNTPWDVANDESSQMYGGIAGETAKAREAVNATRGKVLVTTCKDQTGIFCAFYSSCSGPSSQDPFEAWGDPSIAPLAGRLLGNADAASPKYRWPAPLAIAKSDLTRVINAWGQRNSLPYLQGLGPIKTVAVTKSNAVTGRPVEITLTDAAGHSAPIRAEEFRLALKTDPWDAAPKPPSSCFKLRDAGAQILLYDGYGFGHGIGMSQWGAQNLAQSGRTAEQILAFYYPGSKLQQAW